MSRQKHVERALDAAPGRKQQLCPSLDAKRMCVDLRSLYRFLPGKFCTVRTDAVYTLVRLAQTLEV